MIHPMHVSDALRRAVREQIQPMVGVYDVFSATLAARHFNGLFLSGFGFAASHYGLPDVGFISWSDMLGFVGRIRIMLPRHHLLVDIDDGYGDPDIAAQVTIRMEQAGASGIVLEDQRRPRRCGHYDGKQLLELDEYLPKLRRVLESRKHLFVVARTDAREPAEVEKRVRAFAEAGADAVLAEAVPDRKTLSRLHRRLSVPLACNQIAGGKTPAWSLKQLARVGVGLVIYSTPCLFAAQGAIEGAMRGLVRQNGRLKLEPGDVSLAQCTSVLNANLQAVARLE
jgi:2-methylisocitrate lyase-like PEP mutase family enzyme